MIYHRLQLLHRIFNSQYSKLLVFHDFLPNKSFRSAVYVHLKWYNDPIWTLWPLADQMCLLPTFFLTMKLINIFEDTFGLIYISELKLNVQIKSQPSKNSSELSLLADKHPFQIFVKLNLTSWHCFSYLRQNSNLEKKWTSHDENGPTFVFK